jgi:hypothetical protein
MNGAIGPAAAARPPVDGTCGTDDGAASAAIGQAPTWLRGVREREAVFVSVRRCRR